MDPTIERPRPVALRLFHGRASGADRLARYYAMVGGRFPAQPRGRAWHGAHAREHRPNALAAARCIRAPLIIPPFLRTSLAAMVTCLGVRGFGAMSREFFEIGFWTAVVIAAIVATLHASGYSLVNASLPTGFRDMESELAYVLIGVGFVLGLVLGISVFAYISARRNRRQRLDGELPILPSPLLVPPKGSQVEHAHDAPQLANGGDRGIQSAARIDLGNNP